MSDIILEMRGITKEFPGVKALDDVNFAVKRGSIHALVGENGAGKSTLMNVLSGWYPYGSYSGDIIYNGEECRFHNLKDSESKGIVIIHQELALIPYMSIGENMLDPCRGNEISEDRRPDRIIENADQGHRRRQTADGRNRQGPRKACEADDSGRADLVPE